MFYGIEVKSNKATQVKPVILENAVKFTQACLDLNGESGNKNGHKETVSLVVEYNNGKQFVICNLNTEPGSWQCPLDLIFDAGAQLKFFLRGKGTVHLTGYETFDDMDDLSITMSSDEEPLSEAIDSDGDDDEVDVEDNYDLPNPDSDEDLETEEPGKESNTVKMVKSSGRKVKASPKEKKVNGNSKVPTKKQGELRKSNGGGGHDEEDDSDSSDDLDFDVDEEDDSLSDEEDTLSELEEDDDSQDEEMDEEDSQDDDEY